MRLHSLKPAPGSKTEKARPGRGMGSGLGKTGGRGHKGQHARAGHFKVGFEGGQMPLQRRLPKFGFRSMTAANTAELRVSSLASFAGQQVDLQLLKLHGLVPATAHEVKVILSGELSVAVSVDRSVRVSKGARAVILAAGGRIDD